MKEETAQTSIPFALRWPEREALRRALVPALFVVLALLVTWGYGSGVQLNDGQADLHLDPLKFLWSLVHAWNPALYMGTHTGYWFPYEMPYAWFYGFAEIFHVRQDFAQHVAVFCVYLACLASMYYCLRSVAPWLDEGARIAGSCAYLFNMYVALNSQAQIVWLLTYATLPAMLGITARAMRGEMNPWRAALAIALLIWAGGGVNPPLVAINVILLAIFVAVTLALAPHRAALTRSVLPFVGVACVATVAINLYWIVPFGDFFRGVWLNGVLSEGPSLHNASTSFDNVLRGLGHWATFVSFDGRPYFPWAAPYAQGLFSALLWFVPIVALGGIAFKRNQRPATLYFLIATIVSVPIVVGYYHDALGDAVTTPLYDAFYRYFPGFQMFRFSYKWVAGVELGISALYALSVFAITAWVRDRLATLDASRRERLAWVVPTAGVAFVAVPILVFVPVLLQKMNYPGAQLPAWEYRETALVGRDDHHRVALFPTQFLEQFDWGKPEFYIENSLVDRPMIYGLLGSEPSQGTDVWVRRAYRATREGLPFAADIFRVLGVDTLLQRDDFVPAIDFSFPGQSPLNTTTLTHDLLHRVLGAVPLRADGPLHVYHLGGAMPLVYGVLHPVVSTAPTFTDGYLGDVEAMARGQARFEPRPRSADEFTASMQALSPILPASDEQIRDLAVNQALTHGVRVNPPSANADWLVPFDVKSGDFYAVFAREEALLFENPPPATLQVDGRYYSQQTTGGAWTQYGQVLLSAGRHSVSDGYVDPNLVVAFVKVDELDAWRKRLAALGRSMPKNLASEMLVYRRVAHVTVSSSGRYRVTASATDPFGPDGLIKASLLRGGASHARFPANLGSTLPYIFDGGIVGTSAILMPPRWYRDDPTAYRWQRGDPESWFLFPGVAHVRVFVPGRDGVVVRVSMRVSRLQVAPALRVAVNGRAQRTVLLEGGAAGDQQYDTVDQLAGPVPVPASFTLSLGPGWNDVAFDFQSDAKEAGDFGPEVISAAVAPDLSFTRIASATTASPPARGDASFGAYAIGNPVGALAGDPDILGSVASNGGGPAWLAVALDNGGSLGYRLFPLPQNGNFDINFMHAFPNDWYDGSQRLVGIWLVVRGTRPAVTGLYYGLHAMPARALRRPTSLARLPIRIDGKLLGAQPVFLRRGRHVVSSADRQLEIERLAIAPAALPKTQPFLVMWRRPSATSIDITAGGSGAPYLLVFTDAFHPEWQATLNGKRLDHVIVNGISNGWIVPSLPQGGTIALRFVGQRYYMLAALVSAVATILLIVLAAWPQLWPIGSPQR